jgi:hypothetical protein
MFKKKYTKWQPIYSYDYRCNHYLVQCRMNIDSGFLTFKTSVVSRNSFKIDLGINPKDQFNKVINDK